MQIAVIGINHKSASQLVREEVTRYFLKRFGSSVYNNCLPVVLLSTCLRSEIYFSKDDLSAAHQSLLASLRDELPFIGEKELYSFFGADCFFHLAAVSAGLESLEVGEGEIKRQVKEAYLDSAQKQSLPSELHFLFQKSLKLAKEVRNGLSFPTQALTSSIWQKISTSFPDFLNKKFLFVGASEINKRVVRFLKSKGISDLTFCNRTEEKARKWAEKERGKWLPFGAIDHLFDYDLLFFATKSDQFLLKKEMVPPLFSKKVLFDLSFPRNVDPTISEPMITLFFLEDLYLKEERKLEGVKEELFSKVERQIALFIKRRCPVEVNSFSQFFKLSCSSH